jgi:ABC-2 type transport system permease protein
MLRVELTTQLLRVRTLIVLTCLAALPVLSAFSYASEAGHRNGRQTGLFGASPYSALNHAMASMAFIEPLLLPILVALPAAAIAASDREWGTLRYLYCAPVSRARLLAAKLGALAVFTAMAALCVLTAGLLAGLAVYGWHPFHIIGAPNLTGGETATRVLSASGYCLLSMLSIATVAFALGILLPRGIEALGTVVALVIAAGLLNGSHALHAVQVVLPMHYWQDWTHLFDPSGAAHLSTGVVAQSATIALATCAAALVLRRRDPAA